MDLGNKLKLLSKFDHYFINDIYAIIILKLRSLTFLFHLRFRKWFTLSFWEPQCVTSGETFKIIEQDGEQIWKMDSKYNGLLVQSQSSGDLNTILLLCLDHYVHVIRALMTWGVHRNDSYALDSYIAVCFNSQNLGYNKINSLLGNIPIYTLYLELENFQLRL